MDLYQFETSTQKELFQDLSKELRCTVCPNITINDSGAELANIMRQQLYRLIKQGQNKKQIISIMQKTYGDDVLYNPPITFTTGILWGAPFIIAFIFIIIFLKPKAL